MNSKVYKTCAVPLCVNTSLKTPNKVFVYVPHDKTVRNKWLNLARRDPTAINPKTRIYFCEDHFNLPNDMDNYIEYHVMGSVSQVRMKPGCLPTKFQCQPDRIKRTSDTTERSYMIKKQRRILIEECMNEVEGRSTMTKHLELEQTATGMSVLPENIVTQEEHKTVHKAIQVHITHKFRSKVAQTDQKLVNQMTSPIKTSVQCVATSPFEVTRFNTATASFSEEHKSNSDISYTPSLPSESVKTRESSNCSELQEEERKQEASQILKCTLLKINKNPRSYLGLPKSCYYLIGLIEGNTKIPANHICMCLKKIRLNNTFRELADDFCMTPTYASRIFKKNVPVLASVLRPFIVKLEQSCIQKNLPMAFRHKYYNVNCIIDCLEIEIQKPSKAMDQSLTWSEYKKSNTIKYLVSITPNGLVNYISPGYGGRITDTCLVESCDFIKCLQSGMCVMADRGFKHIEPFLVGHGVKLVRPPSVTTGTKLSAVKVRETKQIASLRIHVERVIRRLREFSMLKPHACINLKLVKILDEIIIIACGLINLQDSLIK